MEIIVLLIAVSLVLVALIGYAFFWAIDSGQFDDLDAKGREILLDDDRVGHRDDVPPRPPGGDHSA
ncbi:MAG: cbb3-type cytochrome oxidase assembly protein CcoS [Gammaproteobacteria bacterium]|nr:cbb3-type cytochrome oxidase assembly protein CcoS [Gammaproteobacteria bacterium]MBI5616283.1 cbb3-type cytochrome oxidase assembly protein CcoS [Gammaproteobacteria bacterium]